MRTVLIVEDDHDTRVALRESFEAQGISVITAANGADGFRLLRALQKARLVVLLDQNMPIMDGDEFLRQKLDYPELVNIPVVVMSAVADRSGRLGATAFVRKPMNIEKLIEGVKSLLDGGPFEPPSAGSKGRREEAAEAPAGPGKKSILEFLGLGLLPGFTS